MQHNEPNSLGRSGLFWFLGVVENRMDPLKNGRVQVRCFNYDSASQSELPTANLPWATTMKSTDSASTSSIGTTSRLVEGSWVFGIMIDGQDAQERLVLGSMDGIPISLASIVEGFNDPRSNTSGAPQTPSVTYQSNGSGTTIKNTNSGNFPRYTNQPDLSRLARNDPNFPPPQITNKKASRSAGQTGVPIAGGGTFSEPTVAYAAQYPYNWAFETESGHCIELDDTPGAERVHVYHRSGSFIEILPNGTMIIKAVQDQYELVQANSYESILGAKNLTVAKGLNINVTGGNVNFSVTGNIVQDITGTVTQNITGNTTITCPLTTYIGDVTVVGTITAGGFAGVGGSGTGTMVLSIPVTLSPGIDITGTNINGTTTFLSHTHLYAPGTLSAVQTHPPQG